MIVFVSRCSLVLLLVVLATCAPGAELNLAQDGRPLCVVVKPNQPTPQESTAAEWLQEYLHRVTGADIVTKGESASDSTMVRLFVGDTRAARSHGIEVARLKPEAWIVKSVGNDVLLVGGRMRGSIYAVCEFLEREVGVMLLDPFTEFVPSQPTLVVPDLDRSGQPAFPARLLFTGFPYSYPANGGKLIECYRVFNKNTIGARVAAGDCTRMVPDGVHTFGHFISSKEFGKSHPEYFGIDASGKRVTDDMGTPSAWTQLCMTNADVRRIVLERSQKFLRDDIDNAKKEGREPTGILTISQNDNTQNLCQCPDCKAIADREGSESGPLLDFINHIARGVKDEFPDVVVQTEAYNFTLQAPRTIRPDSNVLVRFCDNYGYSDSTRPLIDPQNARVKGMLEEWRATKCKLGIWDYWRVFPQPPPGLFAPNSNVRAMSADLPFFQDAGVELMTVECEDLFGAGMSDSYISADLQSFMPLRVWIGMKLLDHPRGVAFRNDSSTDPTEAQAAYLTGLIDRFCAGYYGPAAQPMSALLHGIESRQAELPTRIVDVPRHVWAEKVCDAAFFADAYRLLDEALQATADRPDIQSRIRRERIVIDSAFLWLEGHLRRQDAKLAKSFPQRSEVLARHREDWRIYLATVFDPEGLKIVTPIVDKGIALAEKLRPEDTRYEGTANRVAETDVTLDGQLTEPFWQRAEVNRLLPRDPSQPNDHPATIRTAWTDEALYIGVDQPLDRTFGTLGFVVQSADRKGLQLTLYTRQQAGELPLNPYFYKYDAAGVAVEAVTGRKTTSQCIGHRSTTNQTTELRFRWSDIEAQPGLASKPEDRRFLLSIEGYPEVNSPTPSHLLSPWLIGTTPTWSSTYFKALRLD